MKFVLLYACLVMASADLAPLITSKQRAVPNSWIVKIKDSSLLDQVESEILSRFAVRRAPSPRVTKLRNIMPVLTLKIPSDLLNDVRSIDGIEFIEQDSILSLAGSQPNPPWGLDRIDTRKGLDGFYNYNDNVQGKGVNVYMVDSGININHNCFGGRAHLLYGVADDHGHGTHCSGTAVGDTYGIARQAEIYSVKVCQSGGCPVSTTLDGADAIIKHGGSKGGVVSMSLSGTWGASVLNDMAKKLFNAGYLLSHAAGNYNYDACNYAPQMNWQYLVVVGAIDDNDYRASFSNFGACVPIFAPGVWVESADYLSNSGSTAMSGTSMACPHVTGAAAVLFGKLPNATPQSVFDELLNTATLGEIDDSHGSHNRLLYLDPN